MVWSAHKLVCGSGVVATAGSSILMMVPMSGSLVALTWPPCRFTIALTIERPRPLPGDAMPVAEEAL